MGVPKVIIHFHVMSIINQLFSVSPMYGTPHMYNDGILLWLSRIGEKERLGVPQFRSIRIAMNKWMFPKMAAPKKPCISILKNCLISDDLEYPYFNICKKETSNC